mgnify:CR=1 FL=1
MKNNSVNKRYVPKLRFKGFENNYNKKTINDCFVILNGLSGLKAENFKYGNDKYIPYKTVFNNWFINNNELEFFEKGTKKQNEVTKNDILITSSSETLNEIGYSSIYLDNEKVYLNSFCFILRNISKEVNSQYFNWLMKNKHYRKLIVNEGQGSTRYNLQKKQFKNIVFNFPLLEEQEKISKFLNLLDKQISLLENKLILTEQIKDWIIEFLYKKAKQNKKIKLSEILDPRIVGHIIDLKGYTPISIMLHGKGFKENTLNVKLTKKGRKYYERFSGDLIIGLQNFHNGSIDILNDEYNKPIMSNAIASFINKSEYPLIIIKYILLSKKHQQYLINIAEGTGQKEFTINKILNSYIWIPTHDLIEKFSKFIKTLELQIRNLQIKKDFLEKNKKYYLDNLFI